MEVKDKQIEPAEGVQQPMEEPEVMIQETLQEPSQPEQTTSIRESAFQEWMRNMMESLKTDLNSKMDENSQSTRELSKKMESLQEGLNSTKADLNSKIEEGLNSTKADLNGKEEGQ